MSNIIIKRAENENDLLEISILAEKIWREHFTTILPDGQVDYMLDKFQSFDAMKRQEKEENYLYHMLFEGKKLIGYFAVKPDGDRLFLSKLYIERSCRGKGYSSAALSEIKKICHNFGFSAIWLTVNRFNYHTIDVYRHYGFKIFEECATPIGAGYVMDDYFMQLDV